MISTDQPPSGTLILCDFDGTVSRTDTVNRLVREHIADPEWRFHVKRYMRGEIGSKEVYGAVGPLMRLTRGQLDEFVRMEAQLDPAFPQFLDWARERHIDVKIVSDGFDATIVTLFADHGIAGLEIFANGLEMDDRGNVVLTSPHSHPECERCGTCKVGLVDRFRGQYEKIVLIGDGESDRHAATAADVVIALKDLFLYCARHGIPAIRAEGFHEIPRLLSRRLDAIAFDMDGTLLDSLDTIADSFNHMFGVLGYPSMTVDEVARKTCISLKDFVEAFLKPEEQDRGLQVFRDYYDTVFLEKTRVMPGALETVRALAPRIVQGIITNKRGRYARSLAEHFGFSKHMARIIGAQDGFKAKPSGEMLREFMRTAGTTRENTVYVGDSPLDIEAARNGGIDSFVIANDIFSAQELALHKPRRVLSRIEDLPEAMGPVVN